MDWAEENGSVRELWLFGSRAKGNARLGSDVDIGLVLMPPDGTHNWPFGNFVAKHKDWQRQLEAIVQRHVSLVPMIPDNEGDDIIRSTGVRLWKRDLTMH